MESRPPWDVMASALRALAESEGVALWRDKMRLVGMLLDELPEKRPEIRAVATAAEQNVAQALATCERCHAAIVIDRQIDLLGGEANMRPEVARDVVRAIAHAVGLGPLPSVYGERTAAAELTEVATVASSVVPPFSIAPLTWRDQHMVAQAPTQVRMAVPTRPPPTLPVLQPMGADKPKSGGSHLPMQKKKGWVIVGIAVGIALVGAVTVIWLTQPATFDGEYVPATSPSPPPVPVGNGSQPSGPLRFTDQKVALEPLSGDKYLLTVTATIINVSDAVQRVPQIRAELSDRDQRVLYVTMLAPPLSELQPGESVSFTSSSTDVPQGSSVKLSFRDER